MIKNAITLFQLLLIFVRQFYFSDQQAYLTFYGKRPKIQAYSLNKIDDVNLYSRKSNATNPTQ